MNFFIVGRAQGKTHKILQWFSEDPSGRTVLVPTFARKREFERRIQDLFPDKDMRFCFGNILVANSENLRGRGNAPRAIDDLDTVLTNLFGNVQFVAATGTRFDG